MKSSSSLSLLKWRDNMFVVCSKRETIVVVLEDGDGRLLSLAEASIADYI